MDFVMDVGNMQCFLGGGRLIMDLTFSFDIWQNLYPYHPLVERYFVSGTLKSQRNFLNPVCTMSIGIKF